MSKEDDTRYPYTYACDYLRVSSPSSISRSDASRIRQGVAKALGMEDGDLAVKLADYYLANQAALDKECVRVAGVASGRPRCPRCDSSNILDASQSLDCMDCNKSW